MASDPQLEPGADDAPVAPPPLAPETTAPPGPGGKVPSTRASAMWTAVAVSLVALVVVLVFILQNLQDAEVHFFGASWTAPLGADLLFAAVLGGLLVFAAGSLRLLQLRRLARRNTKRSSRRTHDGK